MSHRMSVGRDGNRSKAAANHTSTRLRMVGSRHLGSPQDPGDPKCNPKWGSPETDIEPSPNPSNRIIYWKWSIFYLLDDYITLHLPTFGLVHEPWFVVCYMTEFNRWRNLIEVRVVAVPLSTHHFGWSRPELVIIHPQQWMFQCPIGFSI